MGSITSDKGWAGGIVGANGFEFENYNEGNITNCYTTEANTKLKELNDGIDESGKNDEQPWVEDTEGINGGYPILNWQKNN